MAGYETYDPEPGSCWQFWHRCNEGQSLGVQVWD